MSFSSNAFDFKSVIIIKMGICNTKDSYENEGSRQAELKKVNDVVLYSVFLGVYPTQIISPELFSQE